jgi:membrane dipeptidase
MESVATYPLITQELLNRGYDQTSIHKILGGNILRVLRGVEERAQTLQAGR